jgi:steroid 5-alpha reductase family enzyme
VSGIPAGPFGLILLLTAAALLVMMAVTFAVALKSGKHSVVDTAWGLFLIALGSWAELPTVIGPLLMTYILTRGTGQRLTDRRMAATRPQYAACAARTSAFVPLPPRRSLF